MKREYSRNVRAAHGHEYGTFPEMYMEHEDRRDCLPSCPNQKLTYVHFGKIKTAHATRGWNGSGTYAPAVNHWQSPSDPRGLAKQPFIFAKLPTHGLSRPRPGVAGGRPSLLFQLYPRIEVFDERDATKS